MEHSPFNRLPRELRDLIYEYAIVHEDGIVIAVTGYDENDNVVRVFKERGSERDPPLALAMVCRQLHEETIGLYYAKNRFYFSCGYDPYQLRLFVNSLKDEHRKQLGQVIFERPQVQFSDKDRRLGRDPLRRWRIVVDTIVRNADGVLPGPVTVQGRVKIGNTNLDLVIDMNKVYESIEENIKAVEDLQRGPGIHVCLRDLQDNMMRWLQRFDRAYGKDYMHLYDAKQERRQAVPQ